MAPTIKSARVALRLNMEVGLFFIQGEKNMMHTLGVDRYQEYGVTPDLCIWPQEGTGEIQNQYNM